MSTSSDGTFHPAVAAVICVGGVCVCVCNCTPGRLLYTLQRGLVYVLMSFISRVLFFSLHMNMCNFFSGHLSGCCEYVRTEMMLNMTQKRAKSLKIWKTLKI